MKDMLRRYGYSAMPMPNRIPILAGFAFTALTATAHAQNGVFFCPGHPDQPHLSIHHGLAAELLPTCDIANGGLNTTITVRAPTEILWKRFRVQKDGALNIRSGDGGRWPTVHRVTNAGIAVIDGSLQSDATVALIAEGGIAVRSTGSVTAPEFLATTLSDVDSQAMLNGQPVTFNSSSAVSPRISIDGQISAPGGVTLLAKKVFVAGSVLSSNGNVQIGAGGRVTLRSADSIVVDSAEREGAVVNTGIIEGSNVEIRVDGKSGPIDSAVFNGGTIRAAGDVVIDAGPEPGALITNQQSLNPVIEGNRVFLTGSLSGRAVNADRIVGDGENPGAISATRQFIGTGRVQTQLRPIQLSTVQRETSTTRAIADRKQKKNQKDPVVVAANTRIPAASPRPEKKKAFYRYRSFFKSRTAE